jgi:uncharacterized protein
VSSNMIRFGADVHLGKLARRLRLLGFDTFYRNDTGKEELANTCKTQNRILLSRDKSFLLKPDLHSFQILHEDTEDQLKAVVSHFNLRAIALPFTRCMRCNGTLMTVEKETVLDQLLPNTIEGYTEFWQCEHCSRLYWKGAHYERMQKWLEQFKTM